MSLFKRLAGQTAIYGLSSIVGRLLNYLLVPIYTRVFLQAEYGVVTEMFGYVGFLMIVFTYGMETSFFRYVKDKAYSQKVFSTAVISLLVSSVVLMVFFIGMAQPIANLIQYPDHPEYIIWFALVLGFDAIASIPFANLRYENRPIRFAAIKMVNIFTNIGLVLFFVVLAPRIADDFAFVQAIYNPDIRIGYIFLANLAASALTLLLLLPEFKKVRWEFDKVLWKKMFWYAMPLMIAGFAGIVNEMLDRILLKYLLPYDLETNQAHLGVYGACYKLSILMTLFTQAFRYAAEPFFFAQSIQSNAKMVYAVVMRYFVAAGILIFLGVTFFIDIFKILIGENFREGLYIVPILLLANLCLGMYYNLSIWYKLTDKTPIGAIIAVIGASITIVLNVLLIPSIGYLGSAWATLICYASMVIISYFWSRKYYLIPYEIGRILQYLIIGIGLFLVDKQLTAMPLGGMVLYGLKVAILLGYVGFVFWKEKTGRMIPH
ncbi:MAG: oligosaccharide flippase family protein [Chitinophagales bacterium]